MPGAFYGALISQGIIASVNSSHSVRWLSSVPNEVEGKGSAAWNKGRILHGGSKEAAREA